MGRKNRKYKTPFWCNTINDGELSWKKHYRRWNTKITFEKGGRKTDDEHEKHLHRMVAKRKTKRNPKEKPENTRRKTQKTKTKRKMAQKAPRHQKNAKEKPQAPRPNWRTRLVPAGKRKNTKNTKEKPKKPKEKPKSTVVNYVLYELNYN